MQASSRFDRYGSAKSAEMQDGFLCKFMILMWKIIGMPLAVS